jgi:ABC-type transport system involved in Fe-S cluster assembly fused permease/ATPase subunit
MDQILLLHEGGIAERGSHQELSPGRLENFLT